MAEPGGNFEPGCNRGPENLPDQRLIAAGVSDRYFLICYEVGGIALFRYVALFSTGNGAAKLISSAIVETPEAESLKSLGDVVNVIKHGRVYNQSSQLSR